MTYYCWMRHHPYCLNFDCCYSLMTRSRMKIYFCLVMSLLSTMMMSMIDLYYLYQMRFYLHFCCYLNCACFPYLSLSLSTTKMMFSSKMTNCLQLERLQRSSYLNYLYKVFARSSCCSCLIHYCSISFVCLMMTMKRKNQTLHLAVQWDELMPSHEHLLSLVTMESHLNWCHD